MLAAAGLRRLGLDPPGTVALSTDEFVPAIGQGALALEARADDTAVRELLAVLDHPPSASAVAAERAFLVRIGGDCQTPLAAYARIDGDRLHMRALVAEVDGSAVLEDVLEGAASDAAAIGTRLAATLLDRGAAAIIARARALAPGAA